MSLTTILLVNGLCVLVVTGIVAAAIDLSKIASGALSRRRARRACKRGWDWPAFEQEVARYMRANRGHRPATPPR
jgi:hypothetical protein